MALSYPNPSLSDMANEHAPGGPGVGVAADRGKKMRPQTYPQTKARKALLTIMYVPFPLTQYLCPAPPFVFFPRLTDETTLQSPLRPDVLLLGYLSRIDCPCLHLLRHGKLRGRTLGYSELPFDIHE